MSKSNHSTGKSAKSDEAATSSKLATGADKSQAGSHQTEGTSGTSGDAQQEQPVSNADQNSGGANGQCSDSEPDEGVYCSTRDGSPSGNGQGVGEATGKPCAGCVGRADNKNPPGQMPGPEDNNNGYECDNNNGIGKGKVSSKDGATSAGNPAHTGCVTPPTVAEECPPGSTAPECVEEEECPPGSTAPECVEEEECPPGSTAPECVEGEGPPPGGNNPPPGPEGNPPPVIGGVQDFANPRPPTVAGVDQFAGQPPAGVLPSTGAASSTTGLMTLGLGLVLTGLAVIGLRRHGMARARR